MADDAATAPTPEPDAPTAEQLEADQAAAQQAMAEATDAERERYAKMTVVQALIEVMRLCSKVAKASKNTQQNFSFRGIDDVVNVVGPATRKVGVLILPAGIGEWSFESFTSSGGSKGTMSQVDMTYTVHGPAGDTLDIAVKAEAADYGDKVISKAYSVALRTALLQTLMLPTDTIDPDAQSYDRGKADQAPPKPPLGFESWDEQRAEYKRLRDTTRGLPDTPKATVGAWLKPDPRRPALFTAETMTLALAIAWQGQLDAVTPPPAQRDTAPEPDAESHDGPASEPEDGSQADQAPNEPEPSSEPPEDAERPFDPPIPSTGWGQLPANEPEPGPVTVDTFTDADGATDFVEMGAAAGHNKAMVLRIARDLAKRSDLVEPVKVDEIDGPLAALLRAELAKALPKA